MEKEEKTLYHEGSSHHLKDFRSYFVENKVTDNCKYGYLILRIMFQKDGFVDSEENKQKLLARNRVVSYCSGPGK